MEPFMRYWTPAPNFIVRINPDSINHNWRASTNDFDFYDAHIRKLDWKPKEEAQADLDTIAKNLGLQEAGTEPPYNEPLSRLTS